MPAESLEQVAARADARVQIEAGDGAARALPLLAIERDEDRRPAELLDDARRDDADHAGMPALLGEHDAVGLVEVEGEHAPARLLERRAVDLLPPGVELLELAGDDVRLVLASSP